MSSRDVGIRVEGGARLRSTLRRAGADLTDLKDANARAAAIAAQASESLAPRRTGRLKATIRSSGTKTQGILRAGSARAPYANAVHWGRKYWPNAAASNRHRSVIRPNPFLSDGARDSEGRWIRVYEQDLQEIIHRIEGA